MINQIGYRTDCWIRGLEGSVEDRGAYYVVRAARNPGFYWGNFLLFKQAPTRSDYKEWQAVFAREFDDTFNHVAFGWDSPDHGEIEDFVNNGFDLDTAVAYDMVECPSPVEALPDLQIRPIESESDWQCVIRLQIDSSRPAGTQETFELFKRRLVEAYRVCCQQGWGQWWGAFIDGKLVADMGLYINPLDGIGRFQSVETHPDYRGRGVCTCLLNSVARQAFMSSNAGRLVICSEPDSQAARVYMRNGFRPVGYEYGLVKATR